MHLSVLLLTALPFFPALNPAPGFDVPTVRVIVPVLFLVWFGVGAIRKQLRLPSSPHVLLTTVFVLVAAASGFWAGETTPALRKALYLFSLLPVLWMAASLTTRDGNRLLNAFAVGAVISAAVGGLFFLAQFIVPAEDIVRFISSALAPWLFGASTAEAVTLFPSWYVASGEGSLLRAFLPFQNPHTATLYWGMGLAIVLARRMRGRTLAAAILLFALLTTFSRGAFIVLGVLFAAKLLLSRRVRIPTIRITPLRYMTTITIVLAFLVVLPLVAERGLATLDINEGSSAGRLALWADATALIQEKPILGVGLGGYAAALDPLAGYRVPTNAHSTYFEIAAETGLLGLLLFITTMLLAGLAALQSGNTAAALALVVFGVHAVFETNIYHPANLVILFLIIGLLGAPRLATRAAYGR